MNTNENIGTFGVDSEVEKLKGEILVGESVVNGARDRYASEIGASGSVERMVAEARVQNRTYMLPKRARKRGVWIGRVLDKIKVVFGLTE